MKKQPTSLFNVLTSSTVPVDFLLKDEYSTNHQADAETNNKQQIHRRQLFSQKIMEVLLSNAERDLLCDDDAQLNGKDCLKILLDIETFLEASVPVGGRVAIIFPPSAMQALAILATMYAGRVPVILNHWTKQSELDRLSGKSGYHALLVAAGFSELKLPIPTSVLGPNGELSDQLRLGEKVQREIPHPETGVILYTSGSMGEPKAVMLPRRGLLYIIETLVKYFDLDNTTVAAITLPIFHTMALNTHFFPTFFAGGKSVFINSELSMGRIYRSIIESGGNFCALIGDMLKFCLREKERRNVEGGEIVLNLQMSGGITRVEHLEMARKIFPNAKIHKGFGLTELVRICMINSEDSKFHDETVGRILPGQQVEIRDEKDRKLPPGVMGQIFVKGPNIMIGYENIPTEQQPIDAKGFLATGDYGILTPDNRLYFKGRIDGTFKSQGRRIACMEIEQVALSNRLVTAAKCIPVKCETKGLRPILFVEINTEKMPEFDPNEHALFESLLKQKLEAYKVPKDVFVLHQIPRLPNNKLCKRGVLEIWNQRVKSQTLGKGPFGTMFLSHAQS